MILRLACLSLLRRPARHALLLLILAAACALPVFLIQMAAGLYNGLNRAVEPFPILAGAKGSPYQLSPTRRIKDPARGSASPKAGPFREAAKPSSAARPRNGQASASATPSAPCTASPPRRDRNTANTA